MNVNKTQIVLLAKLAMHFSKQHTKHEQLVHHSWPERKMMPCTSHEYVYMSNCACTAVARWRALERKNTLAFDFSHKLMGFTYSDGAQLHHETKKRQQFHLSIVSHFLVEIKFNLRLLCHSGSPLNARNAVFVITMSATCRAIQSQRHSAHKKQNYISANGNAQFRYYIVWLAM